MLKPFASAPFYWRGDTDGPGEEARRKRKGSGSASSSRGHNRRKRQRPTPTTPVSSSSLTKDAVSTSQRLRSQARQLWLFPETKNYADGVEKLLRESIAEAGKEAETEEEDEALAAEQKQSLDALVCLLCQAGRDEDAAKLMRHLGHEARLASDVLCYPLVPRPETPPKQKARARLPLVVFDGALASNHLSTLQHALCRDDANYWLAHKYQVFPPSPYFSFVERVGAAPELGALGALVQRVVDLAANRFPAVRNASFFEMWAHRRPHASGHQLHFDSDDEGRGGARHPIVSAIICELRLRLCVLLSYARPVQPKPKPKPKPNLSYRLSLSP